jgi:D-glycero-D-manno-heptose 1,7-bisphosphate phosphatase
MEQSDSRPAIFLDRDGVINESRPDYVKNWSEFRFLTSALDALRLLAQSPYLIVVVTNQSMVGRGIATRGTADSINHEMIVRISAAGGRVDDLYMCPHAPEDHCDCRKPAPGLYLQAAREHRIDLQNSFCFGDKLTDLIPGMELGCKPLLVLTGEDRAKDLLNYPEIQVAEDLLAAAQLVLAGEAD